MGTKIIFREMPHLMRHFSCLK